MESRWVLLLCDTYVVTLTVACVLATCTTSQATLASMGCDTEVHVWEGTLCITHACGGKGYLAVAVCAERHDLVLLLS